MPKNIKITKDNILDVAFTIAREKGINAVSNREIAKRLECSIRPIYYQFKNVDELNSELYERIESYFYKFIMDNIVEGIPKYKQSGVNYVRFAREEKNLFKILFMSGSDSFMEEFITKDKQNFDELAKIVKLSTKLDDEEALGFHAKMWIFTHGIATLAATNTIKFSDEQIGNLLTYEFNALLKMEKEERK